MNNTSHWHRMAYLYKTNALELAEIVKCYMIFDAVGIFKAKNEEKTDEEKKHISINVFDNSELHAGLVYGVIKNLPRDLPVAYSTIGDMLSLHRNTVGRTVKKLVTEDHISQEDLRPAGSVYTLLKEPQYPRWLLEFTEAIVEIELDADLHNAVAEDCKDIFFLRGWDVLKRELKDKFLSPKKK